MIKLRIDVDYPYPCRNKSFLYVALRIKSKKSKDYLKNARIIAKMINDSPEEVKAYWFFTPYTIPDKRLLSMLDIGKHEIGLHIAKDPYRELKTLETETNRRIKYYTIHGTSRLFAQLIWGRRLGLKQAKIPADFELESFHEFTTWSIDVERFKFGFEDAKKNLEEWIEKGVVLSMHPEWLFVRDARSGRGPFYDVLKTVLDVDSELDSLQVRKKAFSKIAHDFQEYEKDIRPSGKFLEKLADRDVDVFTFIDRRWCSPVTNVPENWVSADDNVALLEITAFDSWWSKVGKKTRNMSRKAEKSGVKVEVVSPSEELAKGIWVIYNETPIRQERAFLHYGESLGVTKSTVLTARNSTFIGAFLREQLVGFIQIIYGDNIAIISQILSMQAHRDKAINNALLAKAVEVCSSKGEQWIMYGRIGNHPSLDKFKESNGFAKFPISRYYVSLTGKGRRVISLGLQRDFKDALPDSLKAPLIPVLNWVSRNRMRLRLRLSKK